MPTFKRENGSAPERLSSIEEYLARKDESDRARAEEVARVLADLDHRISKLEAWKVEVLVFIGATKIRWGVVSFVTAALSAIMVAGAIKLLGL